MAKKFVNPQSDKISPTIYTLKYTTDKKMRKSTYREITVKVLYASASVACATARFILGDHSHDVITHMSVKNHYTTELNELLESWEKLDLD